MKVLFAYCKELKNEALNMISALPIFLEHFMGSSKIWKWFTCEAREEASNYKWDPDLGVCPINDAAETNIQLDRWDQPDNIQEETFDFQSNQILHSFQLDFDKQASNTYGDKGSIGTRDLQLALGIPNPKSSSASKQASLNSDISTQNKVLMATSTSTISLTTTPDKIESLLIALSQEPNKAAL